MTLPVRWQPPSRSLLAAALAVTVILTLASQASAQTYGGADYYRLTAKHSGKCLDVGWFSQLDDAAVVQSHCAGTDNQTWAGYWSGTIYNMVLTAKHSGKCLDVKNRGLQHAADVVQRTCDWGPSQTWQRSYIKTVNGVPYYILVNKNSGMCLDVGWFSLADGAKVLQAYCTGTDNQLWDLYNLSYGYHGW